MAKRSYSPRGPKRTEAQLIAEMEKMEGLFQLGATDAEISDYLGLNIRTLTKCKKRHPDFFFKLNQLKKKFDESVKVSMYQRAKGYHHPDVDIKVYKGQVIKTEIVKHYPPDTIAGIFFLKNRQPEFWNDLRDKLGEGKGSGEAEIPIRLNIQAIGGPVEKPNAGKDNAESGGEATGDNKPEEAVEKPAIGNSDPVGSDKAPGV